jgi:ParB family transcriptional regulator, chromosome partitioning protein
MAKQSLGKGLGSLISASSARQHSLATPGTPESGEIRPNASVSMSDVIASPMQPRRVFREEPLDELVASIRAHGLIQPLVVRKVGGKYELIAGERRFRAMQKLELTDAPVRIIEATDRDVLEMALVENLQREDLNPIEEAEAYCRLAAEFNLKQDEIASRVGKERSTVANSMRLMELDEEVKAHLAHDRIKPGHAKAILGLRDHELQRAVADQVVRQKFTVRQTEKKVQEELDKTGVDAVKAGGSRKAAGKKELNAHLAHLQTKLRNHFKTGVNISHTDKRGKIEIEYYGNDDMERVLELLGVDAE